MHNPRISKKERNLIKGAIRRVFSRSELRSQVIEDSIVAGYYDTKRKRVKTWCKCQLCGELEAKSNMQVDHILPVIPLHLSLEEITLDTLIERIWCDRANLQAICVGCHDVKTAAERKERGRLKRERRNA